MVWSRRWEIFYRNWFGFIVLNSICFLLDDKEDDEDESDSG